MTTSGLFDPTIPVLDLHEFSTDPNMFVDKLSRALSEVGFFAVLHSGVATTILRDAYAAAQEFFRLPMEAKRELHRPELNGQRGWVPSESAKGEDIFDWKEFVHIGPESPGHEPNLWPDHMDLRRPTVHLYRALMRHTEVLNRAISRALKQEDDFLSQLTLGSDTLMRLLYYPRNPPMGTPLAAEHTDVDLYTILPLATEEGLEVLNADGRWIRVRVPDGAFIVNAGDMLTNLSNGLFRSSVHRVVSVGSSRERFSIVLFVHGHHEADMSPLPSMIEQTGGQALHPRATEYELLAERLTELQIASPEMIEDLAASGLVERRIALGNPSHQAMVALSERGIASAEVLASLHSGQSA